MTHTPDTLLVRTFVVPNKVERYLGFLGNTKSRNKFLRLLYHFDDFDPRFIRTIPPPSQKAAGIHQILLSMSAPATCDVVSAHTDLDGWSGSLDIALQKVVGLVPGTIVICQPTRLAYYEGESPGDRYILCTDRQANNR